MTNPECVATSLAAERLCMALLKLESSGPRGVGGLDPLTSAIGIPITLAEAAAAEDLASVWRRFGDLMAAVQADLREVIENG